MPQQDYYSRWLSELSGEDKEKPVKKEKPKDYYAEWSAKLSKEPKKADYKWSGELPAAILESSPFLAKLAAASGIPGLSQVAESTLPERRGGIDVSKIGGNLLGQARELARATGMPSQESVERHLAEKKAGEQRARQAATIVTSGGKLPMPPPKERLTIGKRLAGMAGGGLEMGKGFLNFVPELAADFLYDPAKTIEERPADLLFMAEGFFGPRVRFQMKSVIARKKAGKLTKADIDVLVKSVAEEAPKIEPPAVEPAPPVAEKPPLAPKPPAPKIKTAPPEAPKTKRPTKAEVRKAELDARITKESGDFVKAMEGAAPEKTSPVPPGMTSSEFMRASLDEIEAAWSQAGGRDVKGLGVQMVDKNGKPITMTEFMRQKRGVKAAEDFIVAATGRAIPKPQEVPPTAAIPPGGEIKADLLKRIKQAKTMTKEQKKIISAERGARLGAFEAATEGLTGIEKTRAFDKHFAGKHTRIQYEPFLDKLTPDAIDGMHAMIWDSKFLGKFEKRSTIDGLQSVLMGIQPQRAQLEKLTRVFGSELVDALAKHSSSAEKLVSLMVDVGNIPRAFMASMDLSAPFRQGIVMISRPKQFFPAMGKMFGYFGSEESYHALLKDIVSRPTYSLMRRGGLSITEVGGALGKAEEAFASRIANKFPGVRPSARAYTGFLDKLRADVFDDLVSKAIKSGLDPHNSDDLIRSIASFVNTATGRGDIKAFNRAATMMNSFFFSPRLAYSRLQMMNPAWYAKQNPFVRKEAIKSVLTSMGVGASVVGMAKLAGLDVSLNPRTADFLKIRSGNTRLDIFGGLSQYWRLFLNLGDYLVTKPLGITNKDKGGASGLDKILRFVEAKEAPVASLATDILRGKTYLGEELKLGRMVASRLIPMLGQDLYDVIKDDPESLDLILAVFSTGLFGVGVQTYETNKKKPKRMY